MKSKSLLKKQIGVFIFLFIFMFTNFLGDIVPFINYSVVFGEAEDKIYEKDFKNSEISNWNFYKGKGDLKIEDSKLKVTRDTTGDNNMMMADENSPEILNAEAEVKFSIKDEERQIWDCFKSIRS